MTTRPALAWLVCVLLVGTLVSPGASSGARLDQPVAEGAGIARTPTQADTPRIETGPPYTLLAPDGSRPLPTRLANGQEMFALDDLARLFELTVREDSLAGGLTVSHRGQTIVLSPGQALASAGGRLISLPTSPVREGRSWLVPVEFVSRALALIAPVRLDLRRSSRLLVVGDLRVPRVVSRYDAVGSRARLTFDIDPATPHRVTREGARLVVTFEADALDARLPMPGARDLVTAVRTGDGQPTIVVELGPRVGSFRAADLPGERGAGRLVVEVLPETTGPPAPEPPAPTEPAPAPAPPPPLIEVPEPGAIRAIAVDPGHGGEELGARGPGGTVEKEVTLAVARRLKGAIEARLGIRVILTRDGDQTVRLDERAARANNNKADLFISLHANASLRAATAGAAVYYLSLDEYGIEAGQLARAGGVALPVFGGGAREIEVIPWETAQARYIEQSAVFAGLVERELWQRIPMNARALERAPLRVLVGANMPAVLVEMGFLSNPGEERRLASDAFQAAFVQGLVESVIRFRDRLRAASSQADADMSVRRVPDQRSPN